MVKETIGSYPPLFYQKTTILQLENVEKSGNVA